jgi:hypothetical protein
MMNDDDLSLFPGLGGNKITAGQMKPSLIHARRAE